MQIFNYQYHDGDENTPRLAFLHTCELTPLAQFVASLSMRSPAHQGKHSLFIVLSFFIIVASVVLSSHHVGCLLKISNTRATTIFQQPYRDLFSATWCLIVVVFYFVLLLLLFCHFVLSPCWMSAANLKYSRKQCEIFHQPYRDFFLSNLVLKRLLDKLPVTCPNADSCKETSQRGILEDHLKYR